jgi:hypothetical protein
VARSTFRALGATAEGYRIGSLGRLDGAELDIATVAGRRYDEPGAQVTANVVLWARPQTIVIGRAAWNRLTAAQRAILRRAGREALRPELDRIASAERDGLRVVCGRGRASFVDASAAELAALRAAVAPVYAELERDAGTARLLAEIRALKGRVRTTADVARCGKSKADASEVEGAWRSSVSRAQLRATGATAAEARTFGGPATLELADGRWTFSNDLTRVEGTYVVTGDVIQLTMVTCTANPCSPGMKTDYRWSRYRDTLAFSRRPGRPFWPRLVAALGRRAG